MQLFYKVLFCVHNTTPLQTTVWTMIVASVKLCVNHIYDVQHEYGLHT